MDTPKRYTVTAALPYANGPIHLGHLAGVYVPADVYVRYLRQKGRDVVFICGSDEHGVPITIKARREGVTPQQVVDNRNPNSTTIRRPGSSWPTAISPALVPSVGTKGRTATSARSAVRRSALRN